MIPGGPPPPPPPLPVGGFPPPPFLPRGMGPSLPTTDNSSFGGESSSSKTSSINKSIKTVRLHWREAAPNTMPLALGANDSLWSSLNKVQLDTDKLAQLFELKQAEVKIKVILLK
jgi:hypothetical protein